MSTLRPPWSYNSGGIACRPVPLCCLVPFMCLACRSPRKRLHAFPCTVQLRMPSSCVPSTPNGLVYAQLSDPPAHFNRLPHTMISKRHGLVMYIGCDLRSSVKKSSPNNPSSFSHNKSGFFALGSRSGRPLSLRELDSTPDCATVQVRTVQAALHSCLAHRLWKTWSA